MRLDPDETYEKWANRACQYEYGLALRKIAKGVSVLDVLETMSNNITQKLLYPIFKSIKDIPIDKDSLAKSKKNYEETYLNRVSKAADHIDD